MGLAAVEEIRKIDSVTIGLVIGKFWPPHNGHISVIQTAVESCDRTYVIVCAAPNSFPSGRVRTMMIQRIFPQAEVILVDDFCTWHLGTPCIDECTPKWAARTRELINVQITHVFTSEEYGDDFAAEIGATHVSIDESRMSFPISGTEVRKDVSQHWLNLPRIVRQGLFRKIAVIGSESTGTTTLALDLAKDLGAPCAPEAGRTVSWELFAAAGSMEDVNWTEQIFWDVASEQANSESVLISEHLDVTPGPLGPWLVCDTDAVATLVWWDRYLSSDSTQLRHFAYARLADLYVVTSPEDVSFSQDGIRDGEDLRLEMHELFIQVARQTGRPVLVAKGDRFERVRQVKSFITELTSTFWTSSID